jgi:hypothetical protein
VEIGSQGLEKHGRGFQPWVANAPQFYAQK